MSPGLKSDILGGNSLPSKQQPPASSHICCSYALTIISHKTRFGKSFPAQIYEYSVNYRVWYGEYGSTTLSEESLAKTFHRQGHRVNSHTRLLRRKAAVNAQIGQTIYLLLHSAYVILDSIILKRSETHDTFLIRRWERLTDNRSGCPLRPRPLRR